jgi:starvation-inducible DNA-binding protein
MATRPILRDSDLPIGEEARLIVGAQLQGMLVDLIDLSLLGSQVRWMLEGSNGSRLSGQIHDLVESWRGMTDQIADRALAIGLIPDGQAEAIAGTTEIPPFAMTLFREGDIVSAILERLADVATRGRQRSHRAALRDPVTADLLAEVVATLDRHTWMIEAQRDQLKAGSPVDPLDERR